MKDYSHQQNKKVRKYRLGVGVIIINKDKKIYLFERHDVPDSWQCPEGGINEGENPKLAGLREMEEEVGIPANQVKVLAETQDFIPYIIPEKMRKFDYVGQKKKFFLIEFLGENSEIEFNKNEEVEFRNFKLIDKSELLGYIVDFKKDMYKKVLEEFESFFKKDKITVYL